MTSWAANFRALANAASASSNTSGNRAGGVTAGGPTPALSPEGSIKSMKNLLSFDVK
jgi:hypothetical protein